MLSCDLQTVINLAYVEVMKRIAAYTLSAALFATPALAEDDMQDGLSLLEEGAKLFFKGLEDEMEPALKEFADAVEPAMRELMRLVDDMDAYHLPERLPNGDIIMRRKTPADLRPETDEIEI